MNSHIQNIISNIPIYWINLDSEIERKIRFETVINNYGIFNKRISAIVGNNIDINEIKKSYKINKKISKNEIACTLSHIKAIREAYNDNLEYVIIMEDDCNFEYLENKKYSLYNLKNENNDWDIIQLCITAKDNINNEICDYFKNNKLHLMKIPDLYECWGTVSYLLNKRGMQKIIYNFDKNKNIKVSDITIYKNLNRYLTLPYFTYYYTTEMKTCINDRKKTQKNLLLEDKSKIFWDIFYKNLKDKPTE
jgi:GR25 family glycosyltransferase involved in LPS biosynthesis